MRRQTYIRRHTNTRRLVSVMDSEWCDLEEAVDRPILRPCPYKVEVRSGEEPFVEVHLVGPDGEKPNYVELATDDLRKFARNLLAQADKLDARWEE